MNKKRLGLIGGIVLLTIGGVTMMNLNGDGLFISGQTIRQKQVDYLKSHEKEILEIIKKLYPKVESVQFDWSSFKIGGVSNGWIAITGYNLSLRGKFNNLENTDIEINFFLKKSTDMPDINEMGMYHHPMIKRDGGWWVYE